jgi:hypothetical protein
MRTWNDWDLDYVPDCLLTDFNANGKLGGPSGTQPECGAVQNLGTFGTATLASTYDPNLLEGWYTRPYSWTGSAGVEHQLLPRLGVEVTYNRSWRGKTTVTDNLNRGPEDYDEFCVTAPNDPRIGDVAGTQICGLFDADNAAVLRGTNSFITHADNFGKDTQTYNGVDVAVTSRFGRGGLASGGGSWGNTVSDSCYVVDSPSLRFCRQDTPIADFKAGVSYPLPWWDIQAAVNYQNLLAPAYNATYQYTNAEVFPTLGRNLGACAPGAACNQTVTVTLLEPNKQREDRAQQVDLRFSKLVRLGRARVRGRFDIYNVLNSDDVLTQTQTLQTNFRRPGTILNGRTFKFGANFDF